jgi:putative FmdB family regulatory protein
MPIYEYRCASCGHELEALQKLSDAPLTDCPACRETALKKKLSAAGFHLKGSGWYVTDFRSSGSKPAAKDAGGKDGAKDGAKPNGGDAKPEVKSGDTGALAGAATAPSTQTPSSGVASEAKPATTASSDKTRTASGDKTNP